MAKTGRIIKVICANCKALLYKYYKGGPGHLVKCFCHKIRKDYTNGDLRCPKCGVEFARESMYNGKPANKIVQGKVIVKS